MTAVDIYKGKGNWRFPVVVYDDAKALAIVNLTMQKKRPNGHVGMLTQDVYKDATYMAHASSTWGFITVRVVKDKRNYFFPRIRQIRQLAWTQADVRGN